MSHAEYDGAGPGNSVMDQEGAERSFGSLLRAYRNGAGLTQEQLAERAGLSRRGIADLERGARRAPYAHTLAQLRTALELSDDEYAILVETARHAEGPKQSTRTGSAATGENASARPRHNLPLRPNSFIGRATDRARIVSLLDSSPLVTLVGPGGVGKTRLALKVAEDSAERWRDGAWLVELAALTEPTMVSVSLAAVLDIQQRAGHDLVADVLEWLGNKQLLLLLDNCEHMVEACAQIASMIAHTCSDVRVLATSREVLGVDGETLHQVEPLTITANAAASAKTALESEAVRLFVERAVAASPGFTLTDNNAGSVAVICERLDGVPLALELTAAQLRSLSVDDIARRLDQRFTLLTSGNRTALPRHRTLRALVDWSYDLLDDYERDVFEQLSVFSGGWTLDAFEAICITRKDSTLACLSRLIDKSLVRLEYQSEGGVRYAMLETLREYAAEHLRVRTHATEVRQRHAHFYADALRRRWSTPWWSEKMRLRLGLIAADYQNIQTSLRSLVDDADAPAAQRLAGSLAFFWVHRGRVEEGRQWLNAVLALTTPSPAFDAAHAEAVVGLMQLETEGGNRAAALATVEAHLPRIRANAEPPVLAQALIGVGWLTWATQHDAAAARPYLEEGLRLAEASNIGPLAALGRTRLAAIAYATADDAAADRLVEKNRAFRLAGGEPLLGSREEVLYLNQLLERGDLAAVDVQLAELARQFDPDRHPIESFGHLMLLSKTRLRRGDLSSATTVALEVLHLVRDNIGRYFTPGHLGSPLEMAAMIATAEGYHARALRLAGAAAAFRERYAILSFPREQSVLERSLAPSYAALGQRASAAESAIGRALSVDAAIAEAMSVFPGAYTTAYSAHRQSPAASAD